MTSYLARRVLASIVVTWAVITIIFFLIHLLPGDPALLILSSMDESPTPEALEVVRRQLGLDRPIHVQYFWWLQKLLSGDMGNSMITDRPVAGDIIRRLPRTLSLALFAIPLGVATGVPLGVIAAVNRQRLLDPLASIFALIWVSTPVFVSGLLFVYLFSLHLRWLPSGGYAGLFENPLRFARYATLPVITLGLRPMGIVMRMTRSSILEVIQMDYVRTARAKGLAERIVLVRHVLRNALIPVVTIVGLSLGGMFAGSIIVESIFTWPGIGSLLLRGVKFRDYPLVQGVVLIIAVGFILANLLTDLSYAFLDPRIRYQ